MGAYAEGSSVRSRCFVSARAVLAVLLSVALALALCPITAHAETVVATVEHAGETTNYDSLQAAFAAAQDGDTVTLQANTAYDEAIVMNSGTITLDLNDHTITADGTGFAVWGGSLVVMDAGEQQHGSITATYPLIVGESASLLIAGGYFEGSGETDIECESAYAAGGTYRHAVPDAACVSGYIPKQIDDNTYTVVDGYWVMFVDAESGSTSTQAVELGQKATEPSPGPEREGYVFVGWTTDAEGTQAYDFDTPVTQDTVLYAQWKELSYTVSFDANGGTLAEGTDAQEIVRGQKAIQPVNPTNGDLYFAGWCTDAEGTKPFSFTTAITEDITLYASWSQAAAKVGSVTYTTLAEAIAAAGEGDAVTMLASVNVDTSVAISKSITLDLNNQSITSSAAPAIQVSGATLTLLDGSSAKNGAIASTGGVAVAVAADGGLTVWSGSYYGSSAVQAESGATLQVSGGYYEASGDVDIVSADGAAGFISAGAFKHAVKPAQCAEGYGPSGNDDGSYSVMLKRNAVCATDTMYFARVGMASSFVQSGDTLTMLEDAEMSFESLSAAEYAQFTVDFTLDLAGHTITAFDSAFLVNKGTMTLVDSSEAQTGTITGANGIPIVVNPVAGFIMESGTVSGMQTINVEGATSDVQIKGGTLIGTEAVDIHVYDPATPGFVTGGTFAHEVPAAQIVEGYECVQTESGMYTVQKIAPKPGETYQVTFDLNGAEGSIDAQQVKEGGKATEPSPAPERYGYVLNGWYTAAEGGEAFNFDTVITADITLYAQWKPDPDAMPIAKIGLQYYETLAAAAAAVQDGQTIVLLRDAYEASTVAFENKSNVTLDLNGHSDIYYIYDEEAATPALTLSNTSLVITDSTPNASGSITVKNDKANAVELLGSGSALTVEGGALLGAYAVYNENAGNTLSVTGGSLRAAEDKQVDILTASDNQKFVSGGFFDHVVPAEQLAEHCVCVSYGAMYQVIKQEGNVARIGSVEYASLAEAFAAAKSGDTVTLLRDVATCAPQDVSGDVTLDLNNLNIVSSGTAALNVTGGTLSIVDNSSLKTGVVACAGGTAVTVTGPAAGLTVYSGVLSGDYTISNSSAGQTLNIEGGEFRGNQDADILSADGTAGFVSHGAFVHPVPQAQCAEGYVPSVNEDGTYCVILKSAAVAETGGFYYTTLDDAFTYVDEGDAITMLADTEVEDYVWVIETCTLDLAGHTITLGSNFDSEGNPTSGSISVQGSLTVKDSSAWQMGKIVASAKDASAIFVDSGMSLTIEGGTFESAQGSAIEATDAGSVTLNVSGGTFVSAGDAASDILTHDMASKFVTGGIFSHEVPEAQVADGYECVKLEDGTYMVQKKPEPTEKPTMVVATGLVYNGQEQQGATVVPADGAATASIDDDQSTDAYKVSGSSATNAGDYTCTVSLNDGYIWADGSADDLTATWTITKKPVTVTVDSKSMVAGGEVPELTGGITGVMEGDDLDVKYALAEGADTSKPGTYAITATYVESSNYKVTVVEGELTVTKKEDPTPPTPPTPTPDPDPQPTPTPDPGVNPGSGSANASGSIVATGDSALPATAAGFATLASAVVAAVALRKLRA